MNDVDKAFKAQDFLNQLKRFKESIPLKIPPNYLYSVIDDEFLRFHTAGYKQGVKDEKKRISDGLTKLEKNK